MQVLSDTQRIRRVIDQAIDIPYEGIVAASLCGLPSALIESVSALARAPITTLPQ